MDTRKLERVSNSQNVNIIFRYVYRVKKRCPLGIFFCLAIWIIPLFFSCTSYDYIEHSVSPGFRYGGDLYSTRAERRIGEAAVGAEFLNDKQKQLILQTYPFSSSKVVSDSGGLEMCDVYMVTVTNLSEKPVVPGTPWLQSGSYRQEFFPGSRLKKRLKHSSLRKLHKRAGKQYILKAREKRFEYMDTESLYEYRFKGIMPGDTLVLLYFTEILPPRYRSYSLIMPILTEVGEKTVELTFSRVEDRKTKKLL